MPKPETITLPTEVVEALYGVYDTWWNKVGTTDPGHELVSDGVKLKGIAGLLSLDDDQAMDAACARVQAHGPLIHRALAGDVVVSPMQERFGNAWPKIAGTPLDIRPDIAAAPWDDVDPKNLLHGQIERAGLLRHGTSQGRASVALLIRLDDGRAAVGETTWRLFNTTARALAASPVAAEEVP